MGTCASCAPCASCVSCASSSCASSCSSSWSPLLLLRRRRLDAPGASSRRCACRGASLRLAEDIPWGGPAVGESQRRSWRLPCVRETVPPRLVLPPCVCASRRFCEKGVCASRFCPSSQVQATKNVTFSRGEKTSSLRAPVRVEEKRRVGVYVSSVCFGALWALTESSFPTRRQWRSPRKYKRGCYHYGYPQKKAQPKKKDGKKRSHVVCVLWCGGKRYPLTGTGTETRSRLTWSCVCMQLGATCGSESSSAVPPRANFIFFSLWLPKCDSA
jgi:hypothetical protein